MFVVEIHGPGAEWRRIEVDAAEVSIGRDAGSGIQLARGNVSKRHARIVQRNHVTIVVDLRSTNGTYVNGQRLTAPIVVHPHDTISIGDYRLVVLASDDDVVTSEQPLPGYLARDAIEQRLLDEIAARDDAARVVYADWLEQRGELDRAEFLRLQQHILGCRSGEPRFEALAIQLRALAGSIDLPWRMRVARPPVEGCPVAFELQCPKDWGTLEPTDREGVRYCGSCNKTVHYAPTVGHARRHAQRGNCVAIDVDAIRWGRDLDPPYGAYLCPRCNLDVGAGLSQCPSCQAPMRPPRRMLGGIVPPG